MASGVSDELQRRADARRVLTGGSAASPIFFHGDTGYTARAAVVATERTDGVATAFPSTIIP